MKQNLGSARYRFLQRRYAVSLGRRYVLAAASVMLMGTIGCSQIENSSNSTLSESSLPISELPVSEKSALIDTKFISANTKFGFKLFSQLLLQDTNKNTFFSPLSIAFAVAMTYKDASGSIQ